MRITIDHPQLGAIDVLGFPIKFTDDPCRIHRPPPALGADADAILGELGRTPAEIRALRASGVI
jgi:crotonobetainyl-CoA:carnitine CoA-transferase CaiB-like acyl-CoA transferase